MIAALAADRFGQHGDREITARAVPVGAKDAGARQIKVRTTPVGFIPWLHRHIALRIANRLEQVQQPPRRQRPKPTVFRHRLFLVVIAFDREDRNARVLQLPQSDHGVVHRLRVQIAPIEEVSGHQDKIDRLRDRMTHNDIAPGTEEILGPLVHVVAAASQVYVCQVQEFHYPVIICQSANGWRFRG